MRAVCVADVHGDLEAVLRLSKSILGVFDTVFLLGDYSRDFNDPVQNEADVRAILDAFSEFKVYALPGNCDQKKSIDLFNEYGVGLHNRVLRLPHVNIVGFGGSNPTPFNTPTEFSEEEIGAALDTLWRGVDESQPTIVLTHFPPKGTALDVLESGDHAGSSSLKSFIEYKQPSLCVCSHIHENAGVEDSIGDTRLLNVGRLSEGRAYVLEAGESIQLEPYRG